MADPTAERGPQRSGLVLAALILVAAVANLNLAVANVALPDIGKAFDSSQTTLDVIAVGYYSVVAKTSDLVGQIGKYRTALQKCLRTKVS
jgi:hypothetical protein